jgi:hypothetical protein
MRAEQPAAGVTLRPAFAAGETFAYEFVVDAIAKRTGGEAGATAEFVVKHTGTLRLNVLGVDEEGVVSMSAVLARGTIRLESTRGEEEELVRRVEFVHRDAGEGREDAAEEDDAGGDAGGDAVTSVAGALARAVVRFDVMPDGRVKRVTGLEVAEEAAATEAEVGSLVLGPFAQESMVRTLERLWLVDTPRKSGEGVEAVWIARGNGEGWSLPDARPMAYGGLATTSREFRAESGEDGSWRLTMHAKGMMSGARGDPDPTVPKVTLKEWTEEGSAVWDAGAGRVSSRKDRVVVETVATLGARMRGMRLEFDVEVTRSAGPGE